MATTKKKGIKTSPNGVNLSRAMTKQEQDDAIATFKRITANKKRGIVIMFEFSELKSELLGPGVHTKGFVYGNDIVKDDVLRAVVDAIKLEPIDLLLAAGQGIKLQKPDHEHDENGECIL